MPDSLEPQISAILWTWRFTETNDRDQLIENSDLASLLEFWIPYSDIPFTRKHNAWCDGIPLLRVTDLNRTAFLLAGVGYFPNDFSPFELEFHYAKRRDMLTKKIVFRWGIVDGRGKLITFGTNKDPSTIFDKLPTQNRQWAVAVELMPEQEPTV